MNTRRGIGRRYETENPISLRNSRISRPPLPRPIVYMFPHHLGYAEGNWPSDRSAGCPATRRSRVAPLPSSTGGSWLAGLLLPSALKSTPWVHGALTGPMLTGSSSNNTEPTD
jgi:hypothetical protein